MSNRDKHDSKKTTRNRRPTAVTESNLGNKSVSSKRQSGNRHGNKSVHSGGRGSAPLSIPSSGRPRKRVRKRRVRIGGLVKRIVVLLVITVALYSIAQSALFNVDKVSVKGTVTVDPKDVISLSEIAIGQNIFKIDSNKVLENLKTNAMIKDVKVSRQFPNKVQLQIIERTGAAVISSNKGFYIVDKDGYLLKKEDTLNGDFPLVTGVTVPTTVTVGTKVNTSRLPDALILAEKIDGRYGSVINEIKCQKLGELTFYLGNIEIRVGGKDDLDQKLVVLDDVLATIPASKMDTIKYIDVSAPGKPAVMKK